MIYIDPACTRVGLALIRLLALASLGARLSESRHLRAVRYLVGPCAAQLPHLQRQPDSSATRRDGEGGETVPRWHQMEWVSGEHGDRTC